MHEALDVRISPTRDEAWPKECYTAGTSEEALDMLVTEKRNVLSRKK